MPDNPKQAQIQSAARKYMSANKATVKVFYPCTVNGDNDLRVADHLASYQDLKVLIVQPNDVTLDIAIWNRMENIYFTTKGNDIFSTSSILTRLRTIPISPEKYILLSHLVRNDYVPEIESIDWIDMMKQKSDIVPDDPVSIANFLLDVLPSVQSLLPQIRRATVVKDEVSSIYSESGGKISISDIEATLLGTYSIKQRAVYCALNVINGLFFAMRQCTMGNISADKTVNKASGPYDRNIVVLGLNMLVKGYGEYLRDKVPASFSHLNAGFETVEAYKLAILPINSNEEMLGKLKQLREPSAAFDISNLFWYSTYEYRMFRTIPQLSILDNIVTCAFATPKYLAGEPEVSSELMPREMKEKRSDIVDRLPPPRFQKR